jgi:Flp pilus assembly protein CpaB
MLRSLRRLPPRIGIAPRLLIAGTCLLLAASSALGGDHRTPPTPQAAPLVVAARDLPAGRVLAARDLTMVRCPPTLRPVGARGDPAALLGRRLAGPVTAREPITAARLVGADLVAGLPTGLVAAPVVLGDPHTADLVRAGDRVDLLATARPPDLTGLPALPEPRAQALAADVLVLAVLPVTSDADAELVVAVTRETALRIAREATARVFTAVVKPP